MLMPLLGSRRCSGFEWHQVHPTLGAFAWRLGNNLRVHDAGVLLMLSIDLRSGAGGLLTKGDGADEKCRRSNNTNESLGMEGHSLFRARLK